MQNQCRGCLLYYTSNSFCKTKNKITLTLAIGDANEFIYSKSWFAEMHKIVYSDREKISSICR